MNGIHEVTGSIPVWSTKFSFGALDGPQVLESGRCYGGSIEPFSIERDTLRKEQLLESLPLIQ